MKARQLRSVIYLALVAALLVWVAFRLAGCQEVVVQVGGENATQTSLESSPEEVAMPGAAKLHIGPPEPPRSTYPMEPGR